MKVYHSGLIFLEIFAHRVNAEGGEDVGKRIKSFDSVIRKKLDNLVQYTKKTATQ